MENFVSCVLTTCNRRRFFQQALRCFLRQTYDNSELIVVDDGEDAVEDLCRGLFRVHYLRLPQKTNLGLKLNIGIAHSGGDLIQKLDDDDYYHPHFLERGIDEVRRHKREDIIVAWDCFLVLKAGEDRVRHSGHGWAAGGTLLFPRALWSRGEFRDLPRAVDHRFLADHPNALCRVCAPDLYILVRHGRNTWTTINGLPVDDYFARRHRMERSLSDVIEPLDRQFYSSLGPEVPA